MDSALGKDLSSQQQDQNYFHDYNIGDDDHDSDVEGRLYAEIYYSTDFDNKNDTTDELAGDNNVVTESCHTDLPINESVSIICNNNDLINNKSQSNNLFHCSTNNTAKNTSTSQIQDKVINNSKDSSIKSVQDITLSAKPKRPSDIDSECSKRKKKPENNNFDNIVQCQQNDAQKNTLINNRKSECSINKVADVEVYKNTIVNPYNKQVAKNPAKGIKLLSQEFYDLFFRKKSKSQKKSNKSTNNKPMEKSANEKVCNNNAGTCQSNVIEEVINNEVAQNNFSNKEKIIIEEGNKVEKNDTSIVINISSESSEESSEETSKYNAVTITKKKFKKSFEPTNDNGGNDNSIDSSSDSDESIFEVPVPPKPAPVLIDLKDSDSDSEKSKTKKDNYDNVKEGEETNFILNCTGVQKRASNLHEIRTMSHKVSSTTVQSNEINNVRQNNSGTPNRSSQNTDLGKEKRQSNQNRFIDSAICNTNNNDRQSRIETRATNENVMTKDNYFQPMNKKMKEFYDKSWGGESFDMEKLKSRMSSDPRKWAILNDDLIGLHSRRNKRYFGVVCNRCHKDGHKQNQCTEPFKNPTCHMCGIVGHFETSCPHKKCLTCGRSQRMYSKTCENCIKMSCSRCHSRGHQENSCPDLWRQYHDTINTSNFGISKNLKQVMKPQNELFCCNCAKKGHDSNSCKKLRWSQHFSTPSYVAHYEGPVYSSENSHNTGITNNQRIHENLCDLNFASSDSINSSNTYGENSVTSKSRTNVNSSPRQQRTLIENEKNIIFEIKSKLLEKTQGLRSAKLDFGLLDKNIPGKLENWKPLIKFLNTLISNIQGHFWLEQKNNKLLRFHLNCSRNYVNNLKKLVKQYTDRSNIERSKMFLEWDRDAYKIADQLSYKIGQMNGLTENPLQLYEEYRQLHSKSINSTQSRVTSQELSRLAILQEKLLVSLYKECCADDSLSRLQKLTSKIQKLQNLKQTKHKHSTSQALIKFKMLFEFLQLYNNVFTPHQPKNLTNFIENYKRYIEKQRNLMDNCNIILQANINNTVSSATNQILPLLIGGNVSLTSQTTTSIVASSTKSNSNISSRNENPHNAKNSKMARQSGLKLSNGNKNRIAKNKEGKLRNLLKQIQNLLAMARKLNAPHLQIHIDALDNKLKNDVSINHKDTIQLRKLVRREIKKRNRDKVR